MKVNELISQLKELPPDLLVVMAKGGNNYSPLAQVSEGVYEAETTWSGEYFDIEDGDEPSAICLWPTN